MVFLGNIKLEIGGNEFFKLKCHTTHCSLQASPIFLPRYPLDYESVRVQFQNSEKADSDVSSFILYCLCERKGFGGFIHALS